MSSTTPSIDTAVPATHGGDATIRSMASKKLLRASSEADKKPATSSHSPTSNKKARNTASANATAVGDAGDTVTKQPRQTKASIVEALLTREGGASLEALCKATGWQAHTCRAFLTGLRKKGREVIRASDKDGKSIYLIATERSPTSSSAVAQTEAASN